MEEVEKYLKDHVFGTPQLKPDEKNKYLGNFQERVAIALTVIEAKNKNNKKIVQEVMEKYSNYHLYLNGNLDQTTLGEYIALAASKNYKFTIISKEAVRVSKEESENDMGLVIANEKEPAEGPVIL